MVRSLDRRSTWTGGGTRRHYRGPCDRNEPLCEEFGISRKTGHKIYQRYRQIGVRGLTGAEWTRPMQAFKTSMTGLASIGHFAAHVPPQCSVVVPSRRHTQIAVQAAPCNVISERRRQISPGSPAPFRSETAVLLHASSGSLSRA